MDGTKDRVTYSIPLNLSEFWVTPVRAPETMWGAGMAAHGAAIATGFGQVERRRRQTRTVAEVAEILGVATNTIYAAIKRGEIPALKIAGRLVVPTQALDRLLAEGNVNASV